MTSLKKQEVLKLLKMNYEGKVIFISIYFEIQTFFPHVKYKICHLLPESTGTFCILITDSVAEQQLQSIKDVF